jgi:dTDP-4-dehydrorhamnose reductase
MKVLVTGANGIIGKNVAKALTKISDIEVYATSLKKLSIDNATIFTSNLLIADINLMIDEIHPDVVVHCAAISSPDACEVDRYACHRLNVELTKRLLSACIDYNAHLVFLSTDFVFDGKKGNYSEEDTTNPVNYYGESKLEAEKIICRSTENHTIIRTSLVYGYETKLSRPNIVSRVIDNLQKGKPYKVPTDQIRKPTYVCDLAYAIAQICINKPKGIFHISGDEEITVSNFARKIAKALQLDESLIQETTSSQIAQAAPRPLNTTLNIEKIKSTINYSPKSIDLALSEMFKK